MKRRTRRERIGVKNLRKEKREGGEDDERTRGERKEVNLKKEEGKLMRPGSG